jgi:hypothetical protein
VVPRPLPAAPLGVRRRRLIVVPRPLRRCASNVLDRGSQAAARGAAQELDPVAQAAVSGAARCASQILDRGAQVAARGATQILDCGARAVACGAARCPRRYLVVVPRPAPAAAIIVRRRYLIVVPRPMHVLPLVVRRRYLIGVPRPYLAAAEGVEQLGRCTAEQSKNSRLYLYSCKITLAAMYLRRARVVDRTFAAALAQVSTVVTSPAPAAQNLGVGLRRPYRWQAFSRRRKTRQMYSKAK